MQTFLPYKDFTLSAKSLDRQRLGKQRVETLQILNTLCGIKPGWKNHPAVRMWAGYEFSLYKYGIAICSEWKQRGYRDSCAEKMGLLLEEFGSGWGLDDPPWLGLAEFHRSHQSNLVRKDFGFYSPQFQGVPEDLEYFWP